uniref:Uncharacterized protein n=1 Tax=Anopheles albimanus TaxID=7167 RepID=A0A182FCQ6_ANOAL
MKIAENPEDQRSESLAGPWLTSALLLNTEENKARALSLIPLGRIAQPKEISGVCAFLVSDDASYSTGETIVASGGILSRFPNSTVKKYSVASLLMSSSDAPSDASPISCENWAKLELASSGICPSSSWQQSLEIQNFKL